MWVPRLTPTDVTKLHTAHFTDLAPYWYISSMWQFPQLTCATWLAATKTPRIHSLRTSNSRNMKSMNLQRAFAAEVSYIGRVFIGNADNTFSNSFTQTELPTMDCSDKIPRNFVILSLKLETIWRSTKYGIRLSSLRKFRSPHLREPGWRCGNKNIVRWSLRVCTLEECGILRKLIGPFLFLHNVRIERLFLIFSPFSIP